MAQEAASGSYFSESLARGLNVLRTFGPDAQKMRVTEVAEKANLSRSAARRFLMTLQDLGYVGCEGDLYYLRPSVLDLGYAYLSSSGVSALIEPQLRNLAERTVEAATFAVIHDRTALVVARCTKRSWDVSIRAGSRLSLTESSLGLVLLGSLAPTERKELLKAIEPSAAERKKIERRVDHSLRARFAFHQREAPPKLKGLAVPIVDRTGRTIGAINVTTGASSFTRTSMVESMLPLLGETKAQIEAGLRALNENELSVLTDVKRDKRPEVVLLEG